MQCPWQTLFVCLYSFLPTALVKQFLLICEMVSTITMFFLLSLTTFTLHSLGFSNHPGPVSKRTTESRANKAEAWQKPVNAMNLCFAHANPLNHQAGKVWWAPHSGAPSFQICPITFYQGSHSFCAKGLFFSSKLRQPPPHPPFLQALQDTTLWYRGPQWCHNDVEGGGGASRHSFIQSHQFSGRVLGLRECIHIKAMLSNSPHSRLGTGVKTSSKGLASIYAHAYGSDIQDPRHPISPDSSTNVRIRA